MFEIECLEDRISPSAVAAPVVPAKDLTAGSGAMVSVMQDASAQTNADLKGGASPAQLKADLTVEAALAKADAAVVKAEFKADADIAANTTSGAQLLELVKAEGQSFTNYTIVGDTLNADAASVS